MSVGTNLRVARKTRPKVENLESRALLSTTANPGGSVSAQATAAAATTPLKELDYTSSSGGHVTINLYGSGTLAGSKLDSTGVLDLEFSGTTAQSGIIGKIVGGDGHAPIKLLKHSGLPVTSLSGVGSSLLNVVNLKDFDLVAGGQVNLTGGVHIFFLNSVAGRTQVHLRELPAALLNGSTTTGSTSENGVTVAFALDVAAGQTLTNVGGTFIPGTNLFASPVLSANSIVKDPGAPPAPAGVVVTITHVNGPATLPPGLGNPQKFGYIPQIFGYNAASNSLVRYNITTDANGVTTGNPVPGGGILNAIRTGAAANAGASLGRKGTEQVVLVNNGTHVWAYDAVTGAPAGHFSLSTSPDLTPIFTDPTNLPSHIGVVDSFTVVGTAGNATSLGRIVAINLTESLNSGVAVIAKDAAGNPTLPYASARAFGLSGGFASIPGSSTLYTAGGGFFDPYQPNQNQRGVASLSPGPKAGTVAFTEAARNAFTGLGGVTTPSGPDGGIPAPPASVTNPSDAFANIDLNLALNTTNALTLPGTNTITLYSPSNFAKVTSVTLNNTPNLLSAITGTFRPGLDGAALVDINGNTQSFRATDATGMVFNGLGNTNLVKIHSLTDSTIIGYPLAHLKIPAASRINDVIVSTSRTPGMRNGVTVLSNFRPTGPLTEPLSPPQT